MTQNDIIRTYVEPQFLKIIRDEAKKRGVSVSAFSYRMMLDWLDVYYMVPWNREDKEDRDCILKLKSLHKAERK